MIAPHRPEPSDRPGWPAEEHRLRGGPPRTAESTQAERKRLEAVFRDVSALQSYVGHYVAARVDAMAARLRRTAGWTVLAALAAVVGAAMLVTATVLLLLGISHGLSTLFGDRLWLGELVTGLLVLSLLGLGAYLGIHRWHVASMQKIKEKYERRRHHQRDSFGQDAFQRAAEPPINTR